MDEKPPIVITFSVPLTEYTGRTQLRVGTLLMCTVQAAQAAMPQPYLLSVSPSCYRNTHTRGVLASASNLRTVLLTLSLAILLLLGYAYTSTEPPR